MAQLTRAIGLPHATAIVVGIIIGASVFVQSSEITARVPSLMGVTLAWVMAGLLTMAGALVCAELSSALPRTGGVYVFLREIYSPALGFLWGWAMFWSMHTGIAAAIATVFARYAAYFVPMGDMALRLVAVGAILVLSLINYFGVKFGSRVQMAFTVVKVLAVAAIIVAGAILDPADAASPSTSLAAGEYGGGDFLLAVSAGLFAFGGWHMVTYTAEETKNPERTIPRALVLGTLIVTACYVGLNFVYLSVLPIDRVIASTRVAADTFESLVGPWGGSFVSALVMFSAFGALNGVILAGPRVYYSMAQDGLLFKAAAAVASQVQDAGPGDRIAGHLGSGAGVDGNLPRARLAGHLHGVDLLWPASGRGRLAPPACGLRSEMAHAGRPADSDIVCGVFLCDRLERDPYELLECLDRAGDGAGGIAGVLDLVILQRAACGVRSLYWSILPVIASTIQPPPARRSAAQKWGRPFFGEVAGSGKSGEKSR